ncbi:hypothetical protein BTR23_09425 [Alkalihalophilus pseudofirmus]|nr:hypothetical protein BTR23_09425 [Alkalihalophilus pseudofirmus]
MIYFKEGLVKESIPERQKEAQEYRILKQMKSNKKRRTASIWKWMIATHSLLIGTIRIKLKLGTSSTMCKKN